MPIGASQSEGMPDARSSAARGLRWLGAKTQDVLRRATKQAQRSMNVANSMLGAAWIHEPSLRKMRRTSAGSCWMVALGRSPAQAWVLSRNRCQSRRRTARVVALSLTSGRSRPGVRPVRSSARLPSQCTTRSRDGNYRIA